MRQARSEIDGGRRAAHVVEVLSPSTLRYDRFQKLAEYQQHPAIKLILLVDTEAPQTILWRMDAWKVQELSGMEAVIDLPEIGAALPLADLYEGVTFDAAA
jgi:Uma2 family endonuclease